MDAVVVIELDPVLGAVMVDTPVDELPAVLVLDTVVALLDATLAAVVAVVVELLPLAEEDTASAVVVAVVPSFVVATVAPLWSSFFVPSRNLFSSALTVVSSVTRWSLWSSHLFLQPLPTDTTSALTLVNFSISARHVLSAVSAASLSLLIFACWSSPSLCSESKSADTEFRSFSLHISAAIRLSCSFTSLNSVSCST